MDRSVILAGDARTGTAEEGRDMSFGFENIDGKSVPWGYSSVRDWFDSVIMSFPAPWKVAPLEGKYYGTTILDARNFEILSFWNSVGEPSRREKEDFTKGWTPEAWAEYCCDSHWESAATLSVAEAVVALRNVSERSWIVAEGGELAQIIFMYGHWETPILKDVQCGGPGKRAIEPQDKDMRRMMGI